ncbi:hypothetical protein [Rhodobacter sp. NSM]|uniref:hypothetical protein n=1 Tax=Rhodobacter sp. NSM TaxID=3457501 RepID=UPI003FD47BE4
MFCASETKGTALPLAASGIRALEEAVVVLRSAMPTLEQAQLLTGLRVGLMGDTAGSALGGILRSMGAAIEAVALDGRRMPASRRPDAVVVSWPAVGGTEAAEWQQVARMKLDNPRLIVILLDWSRGAITAPEHDLRIDRGASSADCRSIFAELRRLRREQHIAAAARSGVETPVRALFRRPAKPAAASCTVVAPLFDRAA